VTSLILALGFFFSVLVGFFASFSVLWFFFFTGFSVFGNCFLFVYVVLCY